MSTLKTNQLTSVEMKFIFNVPSSSEGTICLSMRDVNNRLKPLWTTSLKVSFEQLGEGISYIDLVKLAEDTRSSNIRNGGVPFVGLGSIIPKFYRIAYIDEQNTAYTFSSPITRVDKAVSRNDPIITIVVCNGSEMSTKKCLQLYINLGYD